jgi:hypothetical protein
VNALRALGYIVAGIALAILLVALAPIFAVLVTAYWLLDN